MLSPRAQVHAGAVVDALDVLGLAVDAREMGDARIERFGDEGEDGAGQDVGVGVGVGGRLGDGG